MLLIKRGLPSDDAAIRSYIDTWRNLIDGNEKHAPHEVQRRLFEHLYENLNILDGKTNSLIQLTAILFAAYAFVATMPSHRFDAPARSLFLLGVVYAAVAVGLCLQVIWVHWSSKDDLENAQQHMISLIVVRTRRTILFRRAWTFAAISLLSLALLLLHEIIVKISYSLDFIVASICVAHLSTVFLYDDIAIRIVKFRS